jgi:hypothetical protein
MRLAPLGTMDTTGSNVPSPVTGQLVKPVKQIVQGFRIIRKDVLQKRAHWLS